MKIRSRFGGPPLVGPRRTAITGDHRPVAIVALLFVLSACMPGRMAGGVRVAGVAPPGDVFHLLLRQSRDLGRARPAQPVSLLLLLRDPTAKERQAALAAMYDPHSRRFGRFVSLRRWQAAYGPSRGQVARVQTYLARFGLTATWQRGNTWLIASGRAAAMARAFGVRIDRFIAPDGVHFWAGRNDPTVPPALRPLVAGLGRLSSYADRHTQEVPGNGLSPAEMTTAYDMTPLRSRGINGAGETIAFIEIDGFRQSDFNAFTTRFNLPPMHPRIVYGGALPNVDGEAELDMEVVHEIAPAARLTVYNCATPCTDVDIATIESRAVRGTPHGIVSISLGGCEAAEGRSSVAAEGSVFTTADALGESVFAASGDSGAYECLTQNWGAPPSPQYIGVSSPASVPGVTAVGGTHLSLNGNGTWYREEAWEYPVETAGSGGGISTVFPRPSWQRGRGVANGFAASGGREVPDVAADADVLTAAEINVKGSFVQVGGTSQAAPIWAGMTALIDQYLRSVGVRRSGFLNPALYALAGSPQPYPPFHDVTVGTNLVYPATPGYDLATGLGTPIAWNLARDLERYIRAGGR